MQNSIHSTSMGPDGAPPLPSGAGRRIVPIEAYRCMAAPQRAAILCNLQSIGHAFTGDGWCYVFTHS